jgi:hypothetical protein
MGIEVLRRRGYAVGQAGRFLSDRCIISTPGPTTQDDTGAEIPGLPVIVESDCYLKARDGLERMTADQIRAVGRYELFLPVVTPVTEESTVSVNGGPTLSVRFVPQIGPGTVTRSVGVGKE